jgi:hypothetical protein
MYFRPPQAASSSASHWFYSSTQCHSVTIDVLQGALRVLVVSGTSGSEYLFVVAAVAFAVLVGVVLLISSAPSPSSSSSFLRRNHSIYLHARVVMSPGFSLRPGAELKGSPRSWRIAGAPTCAPKVCLEIIVMMISLLVRCYGVRHAKKKLGRPLCFRSR